MALEIRTAAELIDPEVEARWTIRRAARETEVLQQVLRVFVERPGPVGVEQIVATFADKPPDDIRSDLVRLDADDLIQIRTAWWTWRTPSRRSRHPSWSSWPTAKSGTRAVRSTPWASRQCWASE